MSYTASGCYGIMRHGFGLIAARSMALMAVSGLRFGLASCPTFCEYMRSDSISIPWLCVIYMQTCSWFSFFIHLGVE